MSLRAGALWGFFVPGASKIDPGFFGKRRVERILKIGVDPLVAPKQAPRMNPTDFANACSARLDLWLPASGGTETPFFSRSGAKLLYCFNPRLGKHAYLRVDGDVILSDAEASFHLALN